jgi:hypothetical protein
MFFQKPFQDWNGVVNDCYVRNNEMIEMNDTPFCRFVPVLFIS